MKGEQQTIALHTRTSHRCSMAFKSAKEGHSPFHAHNNFVEGWWPSGYGRCLPGWKMRVHTPTVSPWSPRLALHPRVKLVPAMMLVSTLAARKTCFPTFICSMGLVNRKPQHFCPLMLGYECGVTLTWLINFAVKHAVCSPPNSMKVMCYAQIGKTFPQMLWDRYK